MVNHLAKLAEWANEVRGRDGRCRVCGSEDRLRVTRVDLAPELRWEVENGITLCGKHWLDNNQRLRKVRARLTEGKKPQRKTLLKLLGEYERENQELRARCGMKAKPVLKLKEWA